MPTMLMLMGVVAKAEKEFTTYSRVYSKPWLNFLSIAWMKRLDDFLGADMAQSVVNLPHPDLGKAH